MMSCLNKKNEKERKVEFYVSAFLFSHNITNYKLQIPCNYAIANVVLWIHFTTHFATHFTLTPPALFFFKKIIDFSNITYFDFSS